MPIRIHSEEALRQVKDAFRVYAVEVDNTYAGSTAREYKREVRRFLRWLEGGTLERGRLPRV